MESDGVLELYKQSVKKYNIGYNPYIGDGSSSSYNAIDRERPYGPNKYIEKGECVNHVRKRMGTNLRALARECKGKNLQKESS